MLGHKEGESEADLRVVWEEGGGRGGEGRGAGERGGERCSSKKISIKMAVLHEVCTAKSLHATDKRLSLTAARNVNCDN